LKAGSHAKAQSRQELRTATDQRCERRRGRGAWGDWAAWQVGGHREGVEGERRAPESPGAAGGSPSGAGERHTGAYPCSAVADIALGRGNGLGRNGRDLNGDGGLRGLGRRCVRLPLGCHAPYNPAFHPRRDVTLEARGRMRAEMEEMGEPTTDRVGYGTTK